MRTLCATEYPASLRPWPALMVAVWISAWPRTITSVHGIDAQGVAHALHRGGAGAPRPFAAFSLGKRGGIHQGQLGGSVRDTKGNMRRGGDPRGASPGLTLDVAYVRSEGLWTGPGGNAPFTLAPVATHGIALVQSVASPLFVLKAPPRQGMMAVPFAGSGPFLGLDTRTHRRPFVGVVGAEAFNNRVLAVDARHAEIAVSQREDLITTIEAAAAKRGALQLRLIDAPNSWSPITGDRAAPELPGGGSGTWLLDTGARWSMVAAERVPSNHTPPALLPLSLRMPGPDAENLAWPLEWSGHQIETLLPGLPMAAYAADIGVARVDGILGMDFLSQWAVVFDLARFRVFFFEEG